MRVSAQGFAFIQSLEGFLPRAVKIDAERFVVGFRHLRFARNGLTISREEAENLLRFDLFEIETFLSQRLTRPIAQAEFDALVSFAFDLGLAHFSRSRVFARVLEGDPLSAAQAFDAEPIMSDDVRLRAKMLHRRTAEKALFLSGSAPQDPLLRFKSGFRPPLDPVKHEPAAAATPSTPAAMARADSAPAVERRAAGFAQPNPEPAALPGLRSTSSVVPFQPARPADPIARLRLQMIAAAQAAQEAQAKALPQGAPIPPLRDAPPALAPLAPMATGHSESKVDDRAEIWPRTLDPVPLATQRTGTQHGATTKPALNWLSEPDFADPQLIYEVHVGDAARTVSDPPEPFANKPVTPDPYRLFRAADGRQILSFIAIGAILAGLLYIGYVPFFVPQAPSEPSAMLILGGIVCLVLARAPAIRAIWTALASRFSLRGIRHG